MASLPFKILSRLFNADWDFQYAYFQVSEIERIEIENAIYNFLTLNALNEDYIESSYDEAVESLFDPIALEKLEAAEAAVDRALFALEDSYDEFIEGLLKAKNITDYPRLTTNFLITDNEFVEDLDLLSEVETCFNDHSDALLNLLWEYDFWDNDFDWLIKGLRGNEFLAEFFSHQDSLIFFLLIELLNNCTSYDVEDFQTLVDLDDDYINVLFTTYNEKYEEPFATCPLSGENEVIFTADDEELIGLTNTDYSDEDVLNNVNNFSADHFNADHFNENIDVISENTDNTNENIDVISENTDNTNENIDVISEDTDNTNENIDLHETTIIESESDEVDENIVDLTLETKYWDVNTDIFLHGVDWVYMFLDTILMYDYKYFYLSLFTTYFDDAYNYAFKIYWFFTNDFSSCQMLYSTYLDKLLDALTYQFPFTQSWYINILNSRENTFLILSHPELMLLNDQIILHHIILYTSYYSHALTNLLTNETFINATLMFIHILLIINLIFFGILLYFSFFTSPVKEENLIDSDHMIATITLEAEEEVASIDDIIIMFSLLLYIFGWFFYAHFWFIATNIPEFILLLYLFPYLYYIIILVPTLLLYDFGVYFVAYLRGVASLPVFLLELVFDFVALMAFYIRILVQGVRLLLMTFTYVSLHHLIVESGFDQRLWIGNESLFDEWNNMWASNGSFSFFFFFSIFTRIYYWIYELLHTFFVLTAQFMAFFAMVFWLFFFLYTFFSQEKHETYLLEKREEFIREWKRKLHIK